jgi:hypothetical protein
MLLLPEDYIVEKFYRFVGAPERNRYNNTYQGSCPICREGSSWLRKRRFYFIPNKNLVYCHNCGYKTTPLKWIKDITGLTFEEIKNELQNSFVDISLNEEEKCKNIISDTLPKDSINLYDKTQTDFYKNNSVLKKAIELVKNRRLDVAINKPKSIYLSLTDKVHKNRLILPFYDENGKIIYYQTRTILENDNLYRPKYISKIGADKTLFNIDKIDSNFEYIFVFEGPINSCFVKNGVAIGGIQENSYQLYTKKQQEQIDKFPFHKKIWILDSQWKDKAAFNKTKKLLELKEAVFLWNSDKGNRYKDFNEMAIVENLNEITSDFILKYTR